MSFRLTRFPDESYDTPEEAVEASFLKDAVLDGKPSIWEDLPDGSSQLVSVGELKARILAEDLGESVAPEPVVEAEEIAG